MRYIQVHGLGMRLVNVASFSGLPVFITYSILHSVSNPTTRGGKDLGMRLVYPCVTVLLPVHTAMAAEVGQSLVIIPHKGKLLVAVRQR